MEIICNNCGTVIPKPDLKTIRDGEIEHTYFLCPDCGEAFRVSTTDKHLRKRIGDYDRMSACGRKGNCTKECEKRMQKLKKENVIGTAMVLKDVDWGSIEKLADTLAETKENSSDAALQCGSWPDYPGVQNI